MTTHGDPECIWLPVRDAGSVGLLRRAATRLGQALGLPEPRVGDLAIVASELGSNLYKHAQDGVALVQVVRRAGQAGVELVTLDRGPGLADFDKSVRDGHSTAGTLGIGLGAVVRQSSEFDAYSQPGRGTVVVASVWPAATPELGPEPVARGLVRPMSGEEISGDGFAVRATGDGQLLLMLCDGLGHGPLAAVAAQAAQAALRSAPAAGPKVVVEHIHGALGHTRGAVVLVVQLDPAGRRARYAGLGNVTGAIVDSGTKRMMMSQPGIAGHQRPSVREFELPWPEGAIVVLHSDGVTDRWALPPYPGLATRTPMVVAATLLRDASVRRDDAAVLVAKDRP